MKLHFFRFILLGLVSCTMSSCAIVNLLLSIPGALIKSGALPVQVVENEADEKKEAIDKVPLGEEREILPVVRNE